MSHYSWKNEWKLQNLKEESFMVKHVLDKTPKWVAIAERKMPQSLQKTLEGAFRKAFVTVFEKGTGLIEKTYQKDRQIEQFQENQKEMDLAEFNGRAIRRFEHQAKRTVYKNMAITSIEGIGLGVLGMGIPDIPIFVTVLLKSIYEIAISYGFSYIEDRERLFILKLIEAALKSGDSLRKKDQDINRLIERYEKDDRETAGQKTDAEGREDGAFVVELQIVRQIDSSAEALSHELLYGKFVQGKALIGVIGGVADITCLKRITEYAALKYKRRFLLRNSE